MEEEEKKIFRVVGYARVSTTEQAEKGYSIEAQLETLKNWCKTYGHVWVGEYVDAGISGKEMTKRLELQKLLADAQTGRFDCVVVWKLNRISRNVSDFLAIVNQLDKENINFVSITESFDKDTPTGRFLRTLLAGIGELERDTIVDNVRMGLRQRARSGFHNGGKIALGYKLIPSTTRAGKAELEVIPEEAEIVRDIYSKYLSGNSARTIANTLNFLGKKTKNGKQFSAGAVGEILDNPLYKGCIRYGIYKNWSEKRRKNKRLEPIFVLGKHEPIVSEKEWDEVASLRRLSSRKTSRSMTTNNILTGLLRCPACGSPMIVHSSGLRKRKNGKVVNYRHYVCGSYSRKGKSVCSSHGIRADQAEAYVIGRIKEIFSSKNYFDAILSEISNRKNLTIDSSKEIKVLGKAFVELETKIAKLEDLLLTCDAAISGIIFDNLKQLKKQKAELEVVRSDLSTKKSFPLETITEERLRRALENFEAVLGSASKQQKYLFMRLLIDHITVDPSTRMVDTIYVKLGALSGGSEEAKDKNPDVKDLLVGI